MLSTPFTNSGKEVQGGCILTHHQKFKTFAQEKEKDIPKLVNAQADYLVQGAPSPTPSILENQFSEDSNTISEPEDKQGNMKSAKAEKNSENRLVTVENKGVSLVNAIRPFKRSKMTMAKKEVGLLLDKTSNDWWFVRNASGVNGYVPANCVKEIENKHLTVHVHQPMKNSVDDATLNTKSSEQAVRVESVAMKLPLRPSNNGPMNENPDTNSTVAFFYICVSPSAIYLRTHKMQQEFLAFDKSLQNHYQEFTLQKATNLQVGSLYAVRVEQNWRRGKVVTLLTKQECLIKFVDFGHCNTIHINDIFPLPDKFKGCHLIKCSLYGIYPTFDTWFAEVSSFIAHRLLKAEQIRINERIENTKKGSNLVVLFYKKNGQWINLNKELIYFGFAYGQSKPIPIPKPIRASRFWISERLPKLGSVFVGTVTCVNSDEDFFLHDVKSQPLLIKMRKLLNQAYNGTKPMDFDLQCRVGDLCIARYQVDKSWNRAIVKEIESNGRVKLFFVDYGVTDSIDSHDVRLQIMLDNIPIQAIRCVLHNVRPTEVKSDFPLNLLTGVDVMILEKEFRVCVKSTTSPLEVTLSENLHSVSVPRSSLKYYGRHIFF